VNKYKVWITCSLPFVIWADSSNEAGEQVMRGAGRPVHEETMLVGINSIRKEEDQSHE